ncbi:molybdopterin molybdotransferase MoeA [Aestuariibacter halophilus]|uniref:Molybdopterin molybdenumtransferase n=1 Tax=Fluctibacter halophilus TaxID=226011 RepID=A0ABS8G784_9ALTE|nr:gephyrin-like molybdotransferase Glp [Aestuariibacter halophilus]MCC2615534.1 molybdopterin molybdotransferase MoeA [Aestuariibacter halophilus]
MQHCDNPNLQSLDAALQVMLANIHPLKDQEVITVLDADQRVLSEDVLCPMDVPPATNSAMDGFALRYADTTDTRTFEHVGQSLAGHPYNTPLLPGQCVTITTGALLPEGADTVVMVENASLSGTTLRCTEAIQPGQHVRPQGDDLQKGQRILAKGRRLNPADLAMLASLGLATVSVYRKPRVTVLATGDELVAPGSPLAPGQIYESNRSALIPLLNRAGVDVIDGGIIGDDATALRNALQSAMSDSDVVISCGGVSVGQADLVKEMVRELGELYVWKLAIKPGKPFAFGKLGNAWFCGLPGNPVSSYVTFEQLVLPVLNTLAGQSQWPPLNWTARLVTPINRRAGRQEFVRARLHNDEQGNLCATPLPKQGSGIMHSIANANCYIVIDADVTHVEAGSQVNIQPFSR